MRTGFLLDSGSRNAGGLFDGARRLVQSLSTDEGAPLIFCVEDAHTAEDAPQWAPAKVRVHERGFPGVWGYAPRMQTSLREAGLDILMTHGLWQYCSVASLNWRRHTGRPLIVHPHGMLDPWAMKHSRWKKDLAWALYEKKHLQSADCLRALCAAEAEAIRALGFRNSVCVIPNGVDLPDLSQQRPAPWGERFSGRRVLLYLGRLHEKKNLLPLLHAWAAVQRGVTQARDWALMIAGWGQGDYETTLRKEAETLGLQDSVHFPGPLFEGARSAAYQNASAFVLPSLSEGLPMVVLEAWAHARSVLMTEACNLPEGFAAGAGWRIPTDAAGIAHGLEGLMTRSEQDLASAGEAGRRLAAGQFSWEKVGAQMSGVSRWLVESAAEPSCLYP